MLIPYPKPALDLDAQIVLLRARGMQIDDEVRCKHYLGFIGYYRLSGYFRFFTDPADPKQERLQTGITFDRILELYVFDRKLRVLLVDALERIEIAVKSAISNVASLSGGAFWYEDPANFDHGMHAKVMEIVEEAVGDHQDSHHTFIAHFYKTYSNPWPPSWMLMETLSFGGVSQLYKVIKGPVRVPIAVNFNVQQDVLQSWLHALAFGRNVCAHHCRVWNRTFTIKPQIPKVYRGDWPSRSQAKAYVLCCIIHHLMEIIADGSAWHLRLRELIAARPDVPLAAMGFPDDWEKQPFWKFT